MDDGDLNWRCLQSGKSIKSIGGWSKRVPVLAGRLQSTDEDSELIAINGENNKKIYTSEEVQLPTLLYVDWICNRQRMRMNDWKFIGNETLVGY